ncbi:MAG: universal stress protein [Chloroflexi bacterium]|nr:universal stress protein [Chloroflexota bacterium]
MPAVRFGRILVPVNGNPTDREAIGLACRVARPTKGKVFAIYVIEVKRTLPLDAELAPEIDRGEQVLAAGERVAREAEYEVETELLQAREVGPAVVDEAVERGADLIIMGVMYKKKFGEFDLGKTVPYVLKNAPCRVWVMREPVA